MQGSIDTKCLILLVCTITKSKRNNNTINQPVVFANEWL